MAFANSRHVAVIKDGRELTVQRFIVKMSVIADLMALVLVQITANVV
jgi:hypothetical protein